MTRRGAVLLLACIVPVAVAVRWGTLLWPGIALLVLATSLVAADAVRAPGAAGLRVEREVPRSFPQGRPSTVRLRLRLEGAARSGVPVLIRDEHPPQVPASADILTARLGADPTELVYTLTPPARGERRFGRVVVRAPGPLGLATRQTAVSPPDDRLRVDPDLTAVGAYEALARRGQLAELGVRTLRRRGEGTEFERIRDAVPDDPLRSINWRATARTGRLMATELIPERAQPVIVCVDHGRLMGVGAGALTKLDHAIASALLLVHVALRTGDRTGALAFADTVTAALPPRPGRMQMTAILDALRPLQPGSVESDYDEAFTHLSRTQTRRALLVIFTDVLDADQGAALVAQTVRLRRRHVPLVVTVRDPALDAAARARPVDVAATYARAAATSLLAERAVVLRTLRLAGVETLDADARVLSPRLVNRYLELKRRGRI